MRHAWLLPALSANGKGASLDFSASDGVGSGEWECSMSQFGERVFSFFKVLSKSFIPFFKIKCITAVLHIVLGLILATPSRQEAVYGFKTWAPESAHSLIKFQLDWLSAL